jgi:ankyrin repeat protein
VLTVIRFLLAILHFRAVSSQLRLKTVRKVLAKLPVGIKDTYDDTVERIQKGQKREQSELAMNVLMLLTHAVEPLNVEQIQHALLALELDEDEEEIDTNDVYDKALLVTICGGLIVVEAETSAIRFVHHTAESYFEDHDKVLFRDGVETMGNMCLAYISLDEFKSGSCQDDDELDERVRSYPLYRYAATNLGKHLGPDAYSDRILEILHSKPLIAGVTQMLVEYALLGKGGSGRKKDLTSQSPFQAAASNGLVKVIRKFISDGQDLDDLEGFGVSALGMAILRDFPEAARVLIENGANVELASTNAQTTFTRRTPFFFAAARGYSDLVAMMLERGANVNAKLDTSHLSRRFEVRETLNGRIYYVDHLYMTTSWEDPRPKAALDDDDDIPAEELEKGRFERRFKENGRPYYVDHLLRRTTWTNPVQDRKAPSRANKEASGPSALGMAAFEGHEDTVKVLLAADGIDVNARDADGRTALSLAAASGHKAVVEALLDAPGVDPDIEDVHERTALSYAAAAPHGDIGIMLMEKGKAKPMSASRKHRSALAFAVHRSQEKLARALLDSLGPDKEAAVNQRDYEMTLGWEVQRSIDGGALYRDRLDHRSRALSPQKNQHGDRSGNDDTTGNTVLMYAAASGNPECVEMLLRAGAEVDARDSFGRTPLMFAATDGHRGAIKVLLELGKADALLMDSVGNTAGYYAVKEKHRDIIGLLPVVGAWGTDLSPPVVDAHSRFVGVADDSWESDGSWETEGEGDAPTEQGDESTDQGEEPTDRGEEGEGAATDEQVGEQAAEQVR